ncbi:hypothetical protein BDA99DRAFT_540476 [Phascolomyces articulosus]|uniref:F-box domain-containing protein n=1 Tax=Phascolomyces articulosus TaxID=60185 RepID=A0AAD5JU67_9FUNG|nr:hypothetical protein BDA99DRAFT_540476 [Phascolomyces articulosus]
MVLIAPTTVAGYKRLDDTYAMSGRQQKVIDTYDVALKNVPKDGPLYFQLVTDRKSAIQQNSKYVDFVATFPTEIAYYILDMVSENSHQHIATCMNVATKWKKTILNKYLYHLKSGSFKRIKTFYFQGSKFENVDASIQLSTVNVFWQIKNTVTDMEFDFKEKSISISISDLLFVCNKLANLKYGTESRLSTIIGNFSGLEAVRYPLKNLCLDCLEITRNCQQIEYLWIQNSSDDVLEAINYHCPNIQILGFDPDYEVTADDPQDKQNGLQEICMVDNEPSSVCPNYVFPLITKAQKSLQVLHINYRRDDNSFNIREFKRCYR